MPLQEFDLALPPQTDQAFLREVDEELRREQLATAWRRWGRWAIVAVVVALVALAAGLWWHQHQQSVAGEQGEQLDSAIKDLAANRFAQAQPKLATLAGADADGYRAVAKFSQADIALQKNDLKGAAAKFGEVAGDDKLSKPYRDLALVRQTLAEYDGLKPQVVIQRLGTLAVKGSPWFGSAGEMVAVAYLRIGKRDAAGKLFGELAQDENVPASIRNRAVQMASVLGVDAVGQTEEKNAR